MQKSIPPRHLKIQYISLNVNSTKKRQEVTVLRGCYTNFWSFRSEWYFSLASEYHSVRTTNLTCISMNSKRPGITARFYVQRVGHAVTAQQWDSLEYKSCTSKPTNRVLREPISYAYWCRSAWLRQTWSRTYFERYHRPLETDPEQAVPHINAMLVIACDKITCVLTRMSGEP